MKIINKYQCEICEKQYDTPEEAKKCEALPVRNDRGVKVGDLVLITSGDGSGHKLRVRNIHVTQPGWGPARFDHSVYLVGDVIDSWGSRQLSYDSYEVLP